MKFLAASIATTLCIFSQLFALGEIENEIDGQWVLTDYFDSVLLSKDLYRVSMTTPARHYLCMDLNAGVVVMMGLHLQRHQANYSLNSGSLFLHSGDGGEWSFYFDRIPDKIVLRNTRRVVGKHDDRTYVYRRARPSELGLFVKDKFRATIARNNQRLVYGTYRTRTPRNKARTVVFGVDGRVRGFEQFTIYEVFSYLGTSNPYGNSCAVMLSDGKGKVVPYAFKISGNELVLFNFEDDKKFPGEQYQLGKEVVQLMRVSTN